MSRQKQRAVKILLAAVICGLAVVCIYLFLPESVGRVQQVEYDYLLRSRPAAPQMDDRLVLFGIDDRTVETLGQYPVSRSSHAKLTEGLAKARAGLVAWDMIFDLPDKGDDEYAAAMKNIPTVLAVGTIRLQKGIASETDWLGGRSGERRKRISSRILERFGISRLEAGCREKMPPYAIKLVMNEKLLETVSAAGHASPYLDADGVCRRVPLVIEVEGRLLPSLALSMAMKIMKADSRDIRFARPGILRVGEHSLRAPVDIPVDEECRMLVNYIPRWQDAIDRRSYAMQLESLTEFPEDMAEGLEGRAILVGETQSAGGDFVPTPLEKSSPGMVVVAEVVNTILTGQFITSAPPAFVIALTSISSFLIGLAFLLRKPLFLMLIVVVVVGGLLAISPFLMFKYDYFLPVTGPLAAVVLTAGTLISMRLFGEHRRSTRTAGLLAKFVSPSILDELESKDHRGKELSVSRRELSILFIDVVGFTERTSHSEPEEIAGFLAAYYDAALSVIHGQGGTLDKVYGDGILAYFGAPQTLKDKECCAVEAALKMVEKASELSEVLAGGGKTALSIRCGITTDYVALGYFGGKKYAAYTVIGRAVNLAARLQQQARSGQVLVDRHTAAKLGDKYDIEQIESITLKGIDKPAEVWRVDGRIN